MIKAIQALTRGLRTQVANMVASGVVQQVNDATKLQTVQLELLADEVRAGLERFQNYGFTSNPVAPTDAGQPEAVVVFPNGRRDHGLVIAVDDRRFRLQSLEPGEVAMYTDQGDKFVFKRDGTVELTCSTLFKVIGKLEVTGDVKFDAKLEVVGDHKIDGKLDVTGDITSSDTITATTDVVGGGKHLKTHTHPIGGATVSTTGTSSAQTGTVDTGQSSAAPT